MGPLSSWRVAAAGLVAAASAGALCAATACAKDYGAEGDPSQLPDRVVADATGDGDDAGAPSCDGANTASDRFHCGRCDHSCLGGACVAGKCQPVEIGRSTGEYVVDVAVDATRVIWTSSEAPWSGDGHVYACPKSGCAPAGPTSLAAPNEAIGSLAGDGVSAYVSFIYKSRRIAKIEPDGRLTQLAGAVAHPSAVRLQLRDGALFYLSPYEATQFDGGFAGTVYAWSKGGERVVAKYDGTDNINDVAATGTRAFISGYFVIQSCDPGATCTDFNANFPAVQALATDGTNLYWAPDRPEVLSCPIAGPCASPMTVLSAAQLAGSQPVQLKYDHGRLYLTTSKNDILACDPASCVGTLQTIAHEPQLYVYAEGNRPDLGESVTSDDEAVYWAAVDGTPVIRDAGPDGEPVADPSGLIHRIMKLAK